MLITIQQFTLPCDNLADGAYTLRSWYGQSYLDSSGQAVASGTATTGMQIRSDVTVSAGFMTFDPYMVYSTLDAEVPNPQSLQLFCQVFRGNTALPVYPFQQSGTPSGWIVPDDLGATISFEEWTIANQRIVLANPPLTFYTAAQVDALIEANNIQVAFNQDYVISAYASFAAAVAAAAVTDGTLVINESTTTTTISVPANVTLRFTRKGSLTVSTGQTATILGPIEADPVKIFFNATAGFGTVSFTGNTKLPVIYSEWWGALGDDSTNNYAALLAAITALGDGRTLAFIPKAIYRYGTALTSTGTNYRIQGNGATLKFTGSGEGLYLNGSSYTNGARNVIVDDLLISGNVSATNGLHLRKVANSTFTNVRATNVSNAGFLVEHGVSNLFTKPVVSANDASFTTVPKYGMYFDWNPAVGAGTSSTNNKVDGPVLEGITTSPGVGIYADNCDDLIIDGGTPEGNTVGYQGTANSQYTRLYGPFGETNSTADIIDAGFNAIYDGLVMPQGSGGTGLIHFVGTAYSAQVRGGLYKAITIDSGATSIDLQGPALATGGTLTDNGTHTKGGYYDVATSSWSVIKSPALQVYGADGLASTTILQLNHPDGFNANAEGRLDYTTGATAGVTIGRVAAHYNSGSIWDLYLYSYNSVLVNVAIFGGDGNVTLGGAIKVNGYISQTAPVTKTDDFTWSTTEVWIIVNKAGTVTATLPAAASFTGRILHIKTIQAQTVVSASSNVVPLIGGSAGTAILAATAGKWATLVSDATNWIITEGN